MPSSNHNLPSNARRRSSLHFESNLTKVGVGGQDHGQDDAMFPEFQRDIIGPIKRVIRRDSSWITRNDTEKSPKKKNNLYQDPFTLRNVTIRKKKSVLPTNSTFFMSDLITFSDTEDVFQDLKEDLFRNRGAIPKNRGAVSNDVSNVNMTDQRQESLNNPVNDALSTPKKLSGNLWESKREENQKLEEELITTKIRELESLSEAKELRLKVMELETQVHVSMNELRRKDDEMKIFREQLEAAEMRVREADSRLNAEKVKYADLLSEVKEALVKARIRDAQNSQTFAKLTQKICELQTKNEEIVTEEECSNLDLL